jgi:hypothetical protein
MSVTGRDKTVDFVYVLGGLFTASFLDRGQPLVDLTVASRCLVWKEKIRLVLGFRKVMVPDREYYGRRIIFRNGH